MNRLENPGKTSFMLALTLVVLIASILGGGAAATRFFPGIQVPVLAIVGIIGLFAAVTVVSVAFSIVGLSDPKQALALPEGSVRAIIAMALIVIFAITTIYLFVWLPCKDNAVQYSTVPVVAPITSTTTDTAQQGKASDAALSAQAKANEATLQEQSKANAAAQQEQAKANAGTQDFAKQLLVMLGTLITSVSSFYFGSSTAKGARSGAGADASSASPAITKIDPPSAAQGARDLQVTISGTNLGLVSTAKIVQAASEIAASIVTSNATALICKLTIPFDAKTGHWDVVVSMPDGTTARLPDGFTVESLASPLAG